MASDVPTVDICGKRILEYVVDCLAKFNRGADAIKIRGIGINTYKAIQVARTLSNNFNGDIVSTDLKEVRVNDSYSSFLTLDIEFKEKEHAEKNDFPKMERFSDFPFYALLLDAMLSSDEEMYLLSHNEEPLLKICTNGWGIKCVNICDENKLGKITGALHRSGMILPGNWKNIVDELVRFDDVILGVDTNILYHAAITEHILSAISLIDKWNYFYTPNWLLIVIPKAVMHEVEQAANLVDAHGFLTHNGRIGFRALQEILEIDQASDIPGVSVTIVGRANPALDTRVEIRELRKEILSAMRGIAKDEGFVEKEPLKPKISSGDTIIRDQFKEFLSQIEFHKGIYFLTADKANRALAEAEGLHAIYYKPPIAERIKNEIEETKLHFNSSYGNERITISVPTGKLIYEMAVEFGKIKASWEGSEVTISCDSRGESLDNWLYKKLMLKDKEEFKKLIRNYTKIGRVPLTSLREKMIEFLGE